MVCPDEEFAAGIAKELQLEEEQLAVDKLTYMDTPPTRFCNDCRSCHCVRLCEFGDRSELVFEHFVR